MANRKRVAELQRGSFSIHPLEKNTERKLAEGDLKNISGGLESPIPPTFPLVPEPPYVPGICPPAPDLD